MRPPKKNNEGTHTRYEVDVANSWGNFILIQSNSRSRVTRFLRILFWVDDGQKKLFRVSNDFLVVWSQLQCFCRRFFSRSASWRGFRCFFLAINETHGAGIFTKLGYVGQMLVLISSTMGCIWVIDTSIYLDGLQSQKQETQQGWPSCRLPFESLWQYFF